MSSVGKFCTNALIRAKGVVTQNKCMTSGAGIGGVLFLSASLAKLDDMETIAEQVSTLLQAL